MSSYQLALSVFFFGVLFFCWCFFLQGTVWEFFLFFSFFVCGVVCLEMYERWSSNDDVSRG